MLNFFNNVIFRRMRQDDIDEIKKIEVYQLSNGFKNDYLNVVIDDWFKDPNRVTFVLEYDGKAIGFYCLNLLDDSRTVFGEALRIHKDFRKLNLTKFFFEEVDKYAKQNYPNAKFKYGVLRGEIHFRHPKNEVLQLKMMRIEKKNAFSLMSAIKGYLNEHDEEDRITLKVVTPEEMYEIFKNDFPKELVFYQLVAVEPTLENFRLLQNNRAYPFAHSFEYMVGGTCVEAKKSYGKAVGYIYTTNRVGGKVFCLVVRTRDFIAFLIHVYRALEYFAYNEKTLFQFYCDVELEHPFRKHFDHFLFDDGMVSIYEDTKFKSSL